MSCFPMIRQAREIIKDGTLGKINQIHVEFLQDWMVPEGIEESAHVKWRLDPRKSGPTSCVGDIGTHAVHLAQFVSGLNLTRLKADFHVCGSPKPLEDTAFMMLEFDNSVPGTLVTSRLASGNRGGLRLRIFGECGGLEWDMEYCENLEAQYFWAAGSDNFTWSRSWSQYVCPEIGANRQGLSGGSYRSVGKFIH